MEQNTTNKTALKYREWIVAAFMDLLKQYSYQEITIKQIVLQADVSRQTFYRHFKSKEEIIQLCSDSLCDEISAVLNSLEDKSIYNILFSYFSFWKKNKDLLNLVKASNCEHLLIAHYNEVMIKSLDVLKDSLSQYSDEEFQMIKSFLIGGLYNIKLSWSEREYKETPAELAQIVCKLLD